MEKEWNIIYEDAELIVTYKPSDLAVQTSKMGQKDLVSMLKNDRVKKKEPPYVAVINRLDQPVEGLVLFAKTKEAAADLSRQLQRGQIGKYYRAVVLNQTGKDLTAGEKGTLTDYLLKDGKTNLSKVVNADTKGAKKAVLEYEVLTVKENRADLFIHLQTGRHHQIRVQMAHANLPLAGDRKYGKTDSMVSGMTGIALCSVKLQFMHPKTKKKMEFSIEPENRIFQLL